MFRLRIPLHGVLTTPSPFTQATAHEMDLAHDDTAAIAHTMSVVGAGGTLVFPEGGCLTHTQTLAGQSPIGLGFQSSIMGFPGEDIFAAVDASQGSGGSQGLAHIHDLTLFCGRPHRRHAAVADDQRFRHHGARGDVPADCDADRHHQQPGRAGMVPGAGTES